MEIESRRHLSYHEESKKEERLSKMFQKVRSYILVILIMVVAVLPVAIYALDPIVKINEAEFRDKIHGAWVGKNCGGTLGMPYEGQSGPFNITYYKEGSTGAPNDDIDIQILNLWEMQTYNAAVDARILGEHFRDYETQYWNEYGVAKNNMAAGIMPPLSGIYNNGFWKDSNGAWCRSDLWALVAPGAPARAVRFCWEDAVIDHSAQSEGVYANMFIIALESAAFVEHDINKLIQIGLSYIPSDCGVAKESAVVNAKNAGKTWLQARTDVINLSTHGGFMADRDIPFVVIGLLYGNDDFGQSICIATNVGDDTDCQPATVGAILGIIHGWNWIPSNWKDPITENITHCCIVDTFPHSPNIAGLTDDTVAMVKQVQAKYNLPVEIIPGATDMSRVSELQLTDTATAQELWARSSYQIVYNNLDEQVVFDYINDPIFYNGSHNFSMTVKNLASGPKTLNITMNILPAEWHVTGLPATASLAGGGSTTVFFTVTGQDYKPVFTQAITSNTTMIDVALTLFGYFGPTATPDPRWPEVNDDASGTSYSGCNHYTVSGYYNNDCQASNIAGSYAQYTFTGTGVRWIGKKGSDHGTADIYIDVMNTPVDTVSTYKATTELQAICYEKTGLSYGTHTIRIVVKSGGWSDFDAYEYLVEQSATSTPTSTPTATPTATSTPTPANTPTPMPTTVGSWTTVNDNDISSGVSYGPNWSYNNQQTNPQYYQNDAHYSFTIGAYVQFTFTGTQVKWIGGKNNDHGKADVYIDDYKVATIDTYNAIKIAQQELFVSDVLSRGQQHTIKIVVTDQTSGSQYCHDIDAFKYINASSTSTPTPTPTATVTPTLTPTPTPTSIPSGHTDEFNSATLDSAWSWVRQDSANWSLTENPGSMRIKCQSGDLWGGMNNAKNLLLRNAPSGDWTMTTKLSFNPSQNYQQAGLMVYKDDDNYVRLTRHYGDYSGTGHIETVKEISGAPVSTDLASSDTSVYLKIVKSGITYTMSYNTDGGSSWTQVEQYTGVDLGISIKVGICCFGGPTGVNADFDWFDIK